MAKLIINGEIASLATEKFLINFHGRSIFTTMRSKNGSPMFFEAHCQRLVHHASYFGYDTFDKATIKYAIESELDKNERDQKIRIILTSKHTAISFEPYQPPAKALYSGVSVIVSSYMVHPQLAAFKTGNSLPYQLAQKQAEHQDAFEALLLNHDGFLVDGSRTSLMLYDGTTLIALEGGLTGIMREEALAFSEHHGVPVKRAFIKPNELNGQLLLANCLLGVVPVGDIRDEFIKYLTDKFRMDRFARHHQ